LTTAKLGQPIARGRTAEIYAWGDGQILKLFNAGWHPGWVDYEARVARAVYETGAPVPAVGDVIELEGRLGLVYGRVEGPSLLRRIQARPWTFPAAGRLLAELHAALHEKRAPTLPPQRERLERRISAAQPLTPELRARALAALQALPDGDRLCHGDFHPDNILITARGPVIIDWVDATRGNPLADVARTIVLLTGAIPPMPGRRLIEALRGKFLAIYRARYRRLTSAGEQEIAAWLPVVAAARLDEGIAEEQERLLALVRQGCS